MSLIEKIIYLADYIDDTRTFPDCVALREMFWGRDVLRMSESERLLHLDSVVLRSLEMTIADLVDNGRVVNAETTAARNYVLEKIKNGEY